MKFALPSWQFGVGMVLEKVSGVGECDGVFLRRGWRVAGYGRAWWWWTIG